jgi:hypothetical protein
VFNEMILVFDFPKGSPFLPMKGIAKYPQLRKFYYYSSSGINCSQSGAHLFTAGFYLGNKNLKMSVG